jgi:hypothetical protein
VADVGGAEFPAVNPMQGYQCQSHMDKAHVVNKRTEMASMDAREAVAPAGDPGVRLPAPGGRTRGQLSACMSSCGTGLSWSLGNFPSTINLRVAAVPRLAFEAADSGLLSPELAAGIQRVKGAKRLRCAPGQLERGSETLYPAFIPTGNALLQPQFH